MTKHYVTIRELARLSGVSVGTVSRALNGYPDVRQDTRDRIVRLAEELDYTPQAAARTLVTRRSHVIGVFLETGKNHPDIQHPFFHEVLVGIKNRLGAAGYDLLLFASEEPGNGYGTHSYLKRCNHHHVDGAVLMGLSADDPETDRLARSSLPCVSVDVEFQGLHSSWVSSDNHQGADLAVKHLMECGHKRIAHIAGPLDTTPGRERLAGFRRAIEKAGLPYYDELVVYGDFYYESGLASMEKLLDLATPPTAVFVASDMMAMGAMRAVQARGLSVPGDVAVVGYDDITIAGMAHPPLTTVRQEKAQLGELAAEALLRQIEEGANGDLESTLTLPVTLVVRESTCGDRNQSVT
ncbi:MAG TPA: LacI family DNA-binding transcriptional regulator [Thermoleophilaceae bacterium]|jgi:LacI family transcriptional regulator